MQRASKHSATLLLLCFLIGGIIAPAIHQVHHGLDVLSDSHQGKLHEHPDYGAVSDNSPHLEDNELSCALCSFSLFSGTTSTVLSSIPDADEIDLDLVEKYQALPSSSFPIRGPPAIC